MVADTLSRVPGSELLTAAELCSSSCTLNVCHVDDLPAKLCPSNDSSGGVYESSL